MIVEGCAALGTESPLPAESSAELPSPLAAVTAITDWRTFVRLRPAWADLVATDPDAALLSHDWFAQAWKCCGQLRQGERPLVLAVHDASGRLRAALPLRHNPRTRRLCFLEEERSQRLDLVAAPAGHAPAWRLLAAALCHRRTAPAACRSIAWDRLDLQFLRASSLPAVRAAFAPHRRAVRVRGTVAQRSLDLARPWSEVEAGFSPYLRANFRRRYKRLQAHGAVSLTCHLAPAGLAPVLADCFALEQRGWKGARGTAIADHASATRFYRQLAFRLAAQGRLRLFCLRVGDRLAAFEYCVAPPPAFRLASLKIAYDETFNNASPGAVLRWLILRDYQDQHAGYEFLGDDAHWKAEWTPNLVCLHHLRIFNRTPGGVYWYLRSRAAVLARNAPKRPA